jgi:hypothetical protein
MDELNKSGDLRPIAFEDIPTPEEHAREVRRIFLTCGAVAGGLLIVALLAIGAALGRGVQLQTLAFVVPIVMGLGIATFAIAYAIPVGLVSLKRLEIAYRMGYFGLGQNREAVGAMKAIADRVKRETAPLPSGRRPSVEG